MYTKTFEELKQDSRTKLILDMRKPEEYKRETYPEAENIYYEEFEARKNELPKDRPIYLICYTGNKSDDWAETLTGEGYEAYSLKGGYQEYLRMYLKDMMEQMDAEEQRRQEAGEEQEVNGKLSPAEQYCKDVERSIVKKFRKDIWRKFTQGINEYEMIQDGDKIAVCISGGKDSMLMAKLFQELERHGRKNFEVVYLVMNPGYNDMNYQVITNNAKLLQVPITVFQTEIFDTVADIGDSPCYRPTLL